MFLALFMVHLEEDMLKPQCSAFHMWNLQQCKVQISVRPWFSPVGKFHAVDTQHYTTIPDRLGIFFSTHEQNSNRVRT